MSSSAKTEKEKDERDNRSWIWGFALALSSTYENTTSNLLQWKKNNKRLYFFCLRRFKGIEGIAEVRPYLFLRSKI